MKPPRTILLLAPDSDTTCALRFVLRNSRYDSGMNPYAVTSVETVHAALLAIDAGQYDLLLIAYVTRPYKSLLARAKEISPYMPTLILTDNAPPLGMRYYDHILYQASMMTLLNRIKEAVRKTRGPRKGSPSAMRCGRWITGRKKINGKYVIPEKRKAA